MTQIPAVEPATRTEPREPWATATDLRRGVLIVGVLAAVGAVAGLLWRTWSLPLTKGYVLRPGAIIPDESEGFVSSDGRFLVITVVIGVTAGIAGWLLRSWRGPVTVLALAVGGTAGSLLTDLVGRLTGGGTTSGAANTVIELPLQVRAGALLLLEPLVAVIVYTVFTAFTARDDLGNPASSGPGQSVPPDWRPAPYGSPAAEPSPGAAGSELP